MSYPDRVRVVEVGPRDGLQKAPVGHVLLRTDDKVALIHKLIAAGLPSVEVGAFVRPDLVPQMADTDDVVRELGSELLQGRVELVALVPNQRGFERAMAAGVRHIAVFSAASEAFNQANIRMSIDESFERFSKVIEQAHARGVSVRGYLSTCFWCPFSGRVEIDAVRRVVSRFAGLGCNDISLADTIGYATPLEVHALIEALIADVGVDRLGVHFHNTRGTALANVLAALELGVTTIDSSAGGLGGCPFAPGAAGNLATEDLVFMLHGMGIETGVDLETVRGASLDLERSLREASGDCSFHLRSRYLRAGPLVLGGGPHEGVS